MEGETDKQRKSRTSQPLVRFTAPDESLKRYKVELFNPATGKAKDALFEEINFNLYKPGAKSFAFKTSESRICFWIRVFLQRYYKQLQSIEGFRITWQEQDAASDTNTCDRIILHLYTLEDKKEQHVVTITIYVSTGTIFVQGKWFEQYGGVEFPLLLEIVNQMQELSNTGGDDDAEMILCTSTLPNFLENISHPTNANKTDQGKESGLEEIGEVEARVETDNPKSAETVIDTTKVNTSEFFKSMTDDLKNVGPESLVYTPSRLKSLTTLRNSVAAIESDFVSFKMEMTSCLQTLESSITTNDGELKDRIVQLQSNSKLHIRNLEEQNEELRASNGKLLEEVSNLSIAVKKLQDQINLMGKKNNKLADQEQVLQKNYESVKMELEKLKQEQPKECPEVKEAVTISQSDISAQAGNMPQLADNLLIDIPLQNRFEVLREEAEPVVKTVPDPVRTTTVTPDPTPQINKKASSVILCDSNGKYLRLNKLCPNRQVTYYRCPTITSGNEIISKLPRFSRNDFDSHRHQ